LIPPPLRVVGIDKENLAVAVNGTLFGPDSGWWPRMSGDLASSGETVVADHVISHISEHTYLLWFDDQLTPYFLGTFTFSAVPGPIVGAGLPGLVAACMVALGWHRRRRSQ
jgi:hypothetical protein